jgi:hypothetical protein
MRHDFRIESTINAMCNGTHVHLAAGTNYSTDDKGLAKFLRNYPGVRYLGSGPIPVERPQSGQFSPCPEPVKTGHHGATIAAADKVRRQ